MQSSSDNTPSISVLFVCMGNICRSPAAEGVFQHLLEESGLNGSIQCDSAGTIGFHEGQPADRRMRESASKRGYNLMSRSRPLNKDDFQRFDHIIAMDQENLFNINRMTGPNDRAKVSMMCEYASNHADKEVPDPYYGGGQGFEHVMDLLEDACSGLLEEVKKDLP